MPGRQTLFLAGFYPAPARDRNIFPSAGSGSECLNIVLKGNGHAIFNDAVRAVLANQGKITAPEPVGSVVESTFPGPAGPIPISIYMPSG